jgi:hypothetical protein
MDEKTRLRQYWLRVLLFAGILWGTMPLITLPLLSPGRDDTPLEIVAVVFYSITILPASVLAFWHRRMACLWLTASALTVAAATIQFKLVQHASGHKFDLAVGILGSFFFAGCLDFMELLGWPGALQK